MLQIPVGFYYVWLAIKARSFFFFSASNPSIETGGMFGESKWKIFELIPENLYPKTIFIAEGSTFEFVMQRFDENKFSYPIMAKPDRGERGWKVAKIENEEALKEFWQNTKVDFLLQDYINLPVELSVFYYRYPNENEGTISSITVKEMLSVTGDGVSTLHQLIENYPRALLQLPVLQERLGQKLNEIPVKGEKVELVPLGNHSKGAMFLDGCHLVDERMVDVFDTISKQIPGFYFGRYDLRCSSIEELKAGKSLQILELNGAGAEPAHIYQPGFSLFKAYGVLFHHFKVLCNISMANHKVGVPYMSLQEFLTMRRLEKQYKQKADKA